VLARMHNERRRAYATLGFTCPGHPGPPTATRRPPARPPMTASGTRHSDQRSRRRPAVVTATGSRNPCDVSARMRPRDIDREGGLQHHLPSNRRRMQASA
jgi:hypothetical protein